MAFISTELPGARGSPRATVLNPWLAVVLRVIRRLVGRCAGDGAGRDCDGLRPAEQVVQRDDIRLGHLERFEFGQFAFFVRGRHHSAEPVERFVQVVHAAPLARVRRQPPSLAAGRVHRCSDPLSAVTRPVASAARRTVIHHRDGGRGRRTLCERFVGRRVVIAVIPLRAGSAAERVVERVAIELHLLRQVRGPQHDRSRRQTVKTSEEKKKNNKKVIIFFNGSK